MQPAQRFNQATLTIMLLIAICVSSGCDRFQQSHTNKSAAPVEREVYALGRLEPAEGIISISAIPGERLKQFAPDVTENALTPDHGILGILASYDVGKTQLQALERKMELSHHEQEHEEQLAKAQQVQAKAGLAQAKAKQKELELQSGKLEALEVASQLAAEEYAQLAKLHEADPKLVTSHQLAKQENRMELANQDFIIASQSYGSAKAAADEAVRAARANIAVATMALKQLRKGYKHQAIEQEITIAKETLKRSLLLTPNISKQALENVMANITNLDKLLVDQGEKSSDEPYTILKVHLRPGEFITRTPIVQLGDLRNMVCIAEVYEADVNDLELGQAVTLLSPAFPTDFSQGIQGVVKRIGSLVAPPNLANRNPLAPADRSVVEVKIEITDEAAIQQAAKLVGMQVTVKFDKQNKEEEVAEQESAE